MVNEFPPRLLEKDSRKDKSKRDEPHAYYFIQIFIVT